MMFLSDDPNLSKEKGKVWYFWMLLVYCFALGTTFFRSLFHCETAPLQSLEWDEQQSSSHLNLKTFQGLKMFEV